MDTTKIFRTPEQIELERIELYRRNTIQATEEFEVWALPPASGLKHAFSNTELRYHDDRLNAAYLGFMKCFEILRLDCQTEHSECVSSPEILQNDKIKNPHFKKLIDNGHYGKLAKAMNDIGCNVKVEAEIFTVTFNPQTHCVVPREAHDAMQEFLKKVGAK